MHGHGFAPPQPARPSTALLVVVRIVLVALALLSLGLLAWGTMLRIAIMRGRRLDWVLFWVSLVVAVTALVVMGEFSTAGETASAQEDPRAVDWVCLAALFALAIGVPVHYLVTDIRHHQPPRPGTGAPPPAAGSPYGTAGRFTGPYATPRPGTAPPAYGYPPVAPPISAGPAPAHHPTPPPGSAPTPQPGSTPVPTHGSVSGSAPGSVSAQTPPPGRTPAPGTPRIDQVRAELDELSDLLRGTDRRDTGHDDRGGAR